MTALISFTSDAIAASQTDENKNNLEREKNHVLWFLEQLQSQPSPLLHQEIRGQHLEHLRLQLNDAGLVLNPNDQFKSSSQLKILEEVT